MKLSYSLLLTAVVSAFILLSCAKDNKGISEAVGGQLPSNYIIISDTGFSPVSLTAVRNSTFTFVNHSGSARGIYSSDSVVINKQNIADNTSYIFTKDTVGTIIYRMAGKPAATGSITITP